MKIKKRALFFLLITLLVSNMSFAQKADDIIGKHLLPNSLEIEVFKENDCFSAKITALNNYKNGQKKIVKTQINRKEKNFY